jgi:hypothetical protein
VENQEEIEQVKKKKMKPPRVFAQRKRIEVVEKDDPA